MVAYASKQAHSSAERAAMLGGVKVRLVDTDEDFSMRGEALEKVIKEDKAKVLQGVPKLHPYQTDTEYVKEVCAFCGKQN